jgi:hypothetical protein
MAAVFGLLADRGIGTRAASFAQPSLDDVFLRETGRSLRDTGAPAEPAPGGDSSAWREGAGMTFGLQPACSSAASCWKRYASRSGSSLG